MHSYHTPPRHNKQTRQVTTQQLGIASTVLMLSLVCTIGCTSTPLSTPLSTPPTHTSNTQVALPSGRIVSNESPASQELEGTPITLTLSLSSENTSTKGHPPLNHLKINTTQTLSAMPTVLSQKDQFETFHTLFFSHIAPNMTLTALPPSIAQRVSDAWQGHALPLQVSTPSQQSAPTRFQALASYGTPAQTASDDNLTLTQPNNWVYLLLKNESKTPAAIDLEINDGKPKNWIYFYEVIRKGKKQAHKTKPEATSKKANKRPIPTTPPTFSESKGRLFDTQGHVKFQVEPHSLMFLKFAHQPPAQS